MHYRLTAKDLAPFFPHKSYDQLRRINTKMKKQMKIDKGGRLCPAPLAKVLQLARREVLAILRKHYHNNE